MKKTIVINLFGTPGAGKSSLAAEIFAELKKRGLNAELVREYVKIWAYQDKKVTPLDQVYLLGKQTQSEAMLYGKVDYLITDSPTLLVGAYQHLFFDGNYIQNTAMEIMKEARIKYGVEYKNFLLPMRKEVKQEGRFHSEDQIEIIDKYLPIYLALCNENVVKLDNENQCKTVLTNLGVL